MTAAKMVPRQATQEMITAGYGRRGDTNDPVVIGARAWVGVQWTAMWDAAPPAKAEPVSVACKRPQGCDTPHFCRGVLRCTWADSEDAPPRPASAPDVDALWRALRGVVGHGYLETKHPAGQDYVSKAAIARVREALRTAPPCEHQYNSIGKCEICGQKQTTGMWA